MTTEHGGVEAEEGPTTLGTIYVTRLLDRHAIPHRQRASRLEKALGLSYQQVRRRLNNLSGWTVEELQLVASHFGETLASLFADAPTQTSLPTGTLAVGSLKVPCHVTVGNEALVGRQGLLVAVHSEGAQPGQWLVVPADQALTIESFEVVQVIIEPGAIPKRRIAVLDDDRDQADSISEYLSLNGYDATPYYSIESFSRAFAIAKFDGYIFDWLINSHSSRELIAQIRSSDAACPIVLLTGQVMAGKVKDDELSTIATLHRVQLHEKPVSTLSLKSSLERGFDR